MYMHTSWSMKELLHHCQGIILLTDIKCPSNPLSGCIMDRLEIVAY